MFEYLAERKHRFSTGYSERPQPLLYKLEQMVIIVRLKTYQQIIGT